MYVFLVSLLVLRDDILLEHYVPCFDLYFDFCVCMHLQKYNMYETLFTGVT